MYSSCSHVFASDVPGSRHRSAYFLRTDAADHAGPLDHHMLRKRPRDMGCARPSLRSAGVRRLQKAQALCRPTHASDMATDRWIASARWRAFEQHGAVGKGERSAKENSGLCTEHPRSSGVSLRAVCGEERPTLASQIKDAQESCRGGRRGRGIYGEWWR